MRKFILPAIAAAVLAGVALAPSAAQASWLSQAVRSIYNPGYYGGNPYGAPGYPYPSGYPYVAPNYGPETGYYGPANVYYGANRYYDMPSYRYSPAPVYTYPVPYAVPYRSFANPSYAPYRSYGYSGQHSSYRPSYQSGHSYRGNPGYYRGR